MFGAEAVPAFLFFALMFLVPESPRWLVKNGKDAQAEVTVELEATAERYRGQLHRGRGVSTDSLEAAARAFLAAVNRVAVGSQPRLHPQRP